MNDKAPVSVHEFSCCNTHGGSAFRDWYMLFKHKGVFIGFHNHEWCVMYSSDPAAEWQKGCNAPCSHHDPRPQSSTAKLIGYRDIPDEAKPLADVWVQEAVAIVKERIAKWKAANEQREAAVRQAREDAKQREIVSPWLAALKEPKND